jgi:hypothetical protein
MNASLDDGEVTKKCYNEVDDILSALERNRCILPGGGID